MNEPLLIQSRNNPKIKSVAGLKEAKHRRSSGLFTVEGVYEIQTATGYQYPIKELYCEASVYPEIIDQFADLFETCRCFLASKSVFEKLSVRQNPDGVIAVCEQQQIQSIHDIEPFERPLLILDQLENPGNLGAILRSCAAFGVKDIILDDTALDPYHPNVIRNSRGHSLGLTIYRDNKEDTLDWLNENCFDSFIVSPDSKKEIASIKVGSKTAFILGNEHHGVSQFWKEKAKKQIRIPMTGIVDSLNVSVSASIVLYEVFKQLNPNY